jgi:hypothetical protein
MYLVVGFKSYDDDLQSLDQSLVKENLNQIVIISSYVKVNIY